MTIQPVSIKFLIALSITTLLAVFGVLGIVFIGANSTTTLPVAPFLVARCGVENCHGTDIKCGPNIPQACTEMYQAGDRCRQYVSCRLQNGVCGMAPNSQFTECVACVDLCQKNFSHDSLALFECESRCE